VEEYERLKVFDRSHVDSRSSTTGEGRIMDQAIHNKIIFFIRGIKASLGWGSHFAPGSRTHLANPKKSEFPRWR
jgi:hypothetical protein